MSATLEAQEEVGFLRDIDERLAKKFEIKIKYVDNIPRESSGKYQVFKSEIADTAVRWFKFARRGEIWS